ncbi:invasion associated locus B family protein [Roseovarius nanhaiticus]|uniref:invasion associated locus B family protein n=1 Tax=Roseovarius nanhaiticus TaxID=573024 RepID=UPI002491E8C1|nr:invasion associated locus B family protein [Roseovarius nanhaiticus]
MLIADRCTFAFGLAMAALWASSLQAQEAMTFDKANRSTVGDWAVECVSGASPADGGCQLYQRVLTQDPGTAAMIAAIAWSPPQEALLAQISLPLGSDLTQQPTLSIDGVVAASFTWSRCVASGCLIEAALPEALVRALARGQTASLTVVQPNAGGIAIPLSLNGFAEGLGRIMPEDAAKAVVAENAE